MHKLYGKITRKFRHCPIANINIPDRVIARHSYLRQFAPALLNQLQFQIETGGHKTDELIEAVQVLQQMNQAGRHKLPDHTPTGFIPKKWQPQVMAEGNINKPA